jgi:hypothetical protein
MLKMRRRRYLMRIYITLSRENVRNVKGFHDEPQCAAVCPVDCCILMMNMWKQRDIIK